MTTPNATFTRIDVNDILQQNYEASPEDVYEIILRGEKINKIEHLELFKNCRSLDLSSNCINILQNLKALKNLRELKVYDNQISEIKNLDSLTELSSLQLQYNNISSVGSGLKKLRKLKQLRLDNNLIVSISVKELAICSSLTCLDLSSNQIQDVSPLNCLTNLEELCVNNNRLRRVQDLGRCRKLESVDFSGNKLVDVSGLRGLPSLTVLDVSGNLLSSLASTGPLKKLKDLNISNNKFRHVERLISAFPELEILKISNNVIDNWDEFHKFVGLENLVELYIDGNPAYENRDNRIAASQELPTIFHLDILNGAQIHRQARTNAPLMHPMSANAAVSVKHVEHQIRTLESEMQAFKVDLTKKFENMNSNLMSLPTSALHKKCTEVAGNPRPLTGAGGSKCGSKSKLRDAMLFASTNFDDV